MTHITKSVRPLNQYLKSKCELKLFNFFFPSIQMFLDILKTQPFALTYLVEILLSIILCVIEVQRLGSLAYLLLLIIPMFILSYCIKRDSVTIIILLCSQTLYIVVFRWGTNHGQNEWMDSQAIALMVGRSFINSRLLTDQLDKLVYFVIILTQIIAISEQYQQPYLYLVFIYMMVLVQQDLQCQQQTKQLQHDNLDLQLIPSQFQDLMRIVLPVSLCVFTQKQNLFQTKELESQFIVKNFVHSLSKIDSVINYLDLPLPQTKQQFQLFKIKKILNQQLYYSDHNLNMGDKMARGDYTNQENFDQSNIIIPNQKESPFEVIQEHNQFLQPQTGLTNNISMTLDLRIAHCSWNGESAVMIIVDDFTKMKNEIEQLKKQEICKDNILASVSHDFKTPINGVVQIIEHLEKLKIIENNSQLVRDEKVLYYLKIIKQSNYFLLFMIYDILDFAMVQKNKLRLCQSRFVLQDLIQEMIELVKIQAQEKHVRLALISKIKTINMYSDPNRLKQIILNLLSNALKYTESGLIEIIIEASFKSTQSLNPFNSNDNLIKLTVKDTGVGIPESIQAKLFDMYATFDHKKGSNTNGIGLGLSICKKLVGLLGPSDDIKLVTEVGLGSSFSFILFQSLGETNVGPNESKGFVNLLDQQANQMSSSLKRISSQLQYFNGNDKFRLVTFSVSNPNTKSSIVREASQDQFREVLPIIYQKDQVADKHFSWLLAEDHDGHKNININLTRQSKTKVKFMRKSYADQRRGSFGSFFQQSPPDLKTVQSATLPYQVSQGLIQDLSSVISQNFTQNVVSKIEITNSILKDKKILIVDDEPFNVMALKTLLSTYAYVDEAFNGQQALKKVQLEYYQNSGQAPFDYIIMDLTMPIMNGYDAAKEFKSLMNKNLIPQIPLIALTGFDDLQEKERCYAVGFDAFMSKPVKLQELLSTLRELQMQK